MNEVKERVALAAWWLPYASAAYFAYRYYMESKGWYEVRIEPLIAGQVVTYLAARGVCYVLSGNFFKRPSAA